MLSTDMHSLAPCAEIPVTLITTCSQSPGRDAQRPPQSHHTHTYTWLQPQLGCRRGTDNQRQEGTEGWAQQGQGLGLGLTCFPVQKARHRLQAISLPIRNLQWGALPLALLLI